MRELESFLHALRFLTIIPLPGAAEMQPDWLDRAAKYFPLVGALIGASSAAVLWAASSIWSHGIAAILAVAAGIVVTGALHEDGLADTADGLGGGRTREACLGIMKDSRLGTYGAIALGLVTTLKIAALAQLPIWFAAAALLAAYSLGRLTVIFIMDRLPYVGDPAASRIAYSTGRMRTREIIMACGLGLAAFVPAALLAPSRVSIAAGLGALSVLCLVQLARRRIGGWTGDILGASEQVFAMVFLLALSAGQVERIAPPN